MPRMESKRWVDSLSDEDLAFIRRFVLASGSLKDMAAAYGISYPTVRLRLDRLIQKIQILEEHQHRSEFEQLLWAQYADGRIDLDMLKMLLAAHNKEMEAGREVHHSDPGSADRR